MQHIYIGVSFSVSNIQSFVMETSSIICSSRLKQHVKRLHKMFCDKVNAHQLLSMQCRPQSSLFYQDEAEYFQRGIESCEQYFKTLDLLELVRELKNWGFLNEQKSLKYYTTDSNILSEIVMDC